VNAKKQVGCIQTRGEEKLVRVVCLHKNEIMGTHHYKCHHPEKKQKITTNKDRPKTKRKTEKQAKREKKANIILQTERKRKGRERWEDVGKDSRRGFTMKRG